ncbi:MAG: AraC family transcriptional regulator [Thermosynechococcaceae cyanobacterium MS004]|nr:AraC family transcriptional regulator [Thermosynechococcaceae cyanobacterium MS004]
MPLILSAQEWEECSQADSSVIEAVAQLDAFEAFQTRKTIFDQGCVRLFQLRDLWLEIEDYQATEEMVIKSEPASWGPISSFFVAGTAKNCHVGLTQEIVEVPGHNYLESIQSGVEWDHFLAKEPMRRVRFGLKPHLFSQLAEASALPLELAPLVTGELTPSFYRQGVTTPEMQLILQQILHCPYQGAIKQMYLEGKVLELAALQFMQLAIGDRPLPNHANFNRDDLERLHQAKAILREEFEHPPSILSLARRVGLNDFKLKQGFRQVFGTTVFGCLHDYRMEIACQLLAEGQLSVQQVARAIGYAHAGYFAKAFKQKFGMNPKAYIGRS